MLLSRRLILICLCPLILSWFAKDLPASEQAWLNNSVTFTITPQWSLKLTQELRALDVTYADPYLHNLQAGIVYHLPKNFYLAALYKRLHVDLGGDIVFDEDRITLEGGWKIGLAKDLSFDIRARTEIRRYNVEDRDHTRFRLRLRLKYDTSLAGLRFKPFVATETFGKTKVYTVQNNRLYLGSIFPLSQHVDSVPFFP
jgi:hypothetical protein